MGHCSLACFRLKWNKCLSLSLNVSLSLDVKQSDGFWQHGLHDEMRQQRELVGDQERHSMLERNDDDRRRIEGRNIDVRR